MVSPPRLGVPCALAVPSQGIVMIGKHLRMIANVIAALLIAIVARAADFPRPIEGDYVIRDFRFRDGKTLPELRMHYRMLGEPKRDEKGIVRNAVLIMHGTTGSGAQ